MTERDWLTFSDIRSMLVFLEGRASERKARLYSCGLGRFLWPYLGDERLRTAVEIGERNADGLATRIELQAAQDAASDAAGGSASHVAFLTADHAAWQGARMAQVAWNDSHGRRALSGGRK